jgi:hypothetical protein
MSSDEIISTKTLRSLSNAVVGTIWSLEDVSVLVDLFEGFCEWERQQGATSGSRRLDDPVEILNRNERSSPVVDENEIVGGTGRGQEAVMYTRGSVGTAIDELNRLRKGPAFEFQGVDRFSVSWVNDENDLIDQRVFEKRVESPGDNRAIPERYQGLVGRKSESGSGSPRNDEGGNGFEGVVFHRNGRKRVGEWNRAVISVTVS